MLEIKLPREIAKSPAGIEHVVDALRQGGGLGDWYAKYFKGNLPITASLEIASIEGSIHFYIRIEKRFRQLVEGNLYAQYPDVEIVLADDYTKLIRYTHLDKDKVSMWGASFNLGASWTPQDKDGKPFKKDGESYKMKADFLPIKTYKDFELNKDPDEEYRIDPIGNILELMGSIGKGQHFWYQIILQDEGVYNNKKMPALYINEVSHERHNLGKMAEARKSQIRKIKKVAKGSQAYDQYGNPIQRTKRAEDGTIALEDVTYGEDREVFSKDSELNQNDKDELEAINNKLSKPLLASLIRVLYVTEKKSFSPNYIQNIVNILRPFAGENSFAPTASDPYFYPWENFRDRRTPWRTEEMFDEYVEREGIVPHFGNENNWLQKVEDSILYSFSMSTRKTWRTLYDIIFRPFYHSTPKSFCVLNTEEIASLWHFPGANVKTPTLSRIDSAKSTPPTNLPI